MPLFCSPLQLTVTDSCADGYRYLLVDSLSTPGELFQCANADLSSFMKARVGNSLTFLTLEAPTLSPVLGARYGDGRSCLQPKAFSFLECNGIRDLTISGTTNPNGGGPFVPLVQVAACPCLQEFEMRLLGATPSRSCPFDPDARACLTP